MLGQSHLRWRNLKNAAAADAHQVMRPDILPCLHKLGGEGSTYSDHMKDARYTIPTAALLSNVLDLVDDIPMVNRDTNGDL